MTQTTDTVKGSKEEICLCASCRNMLYEGDDLVDNVVMKCGELHYIELAHKNCMPEWE